MGDCVFLHHGSNVVVDKPKWNLGSRYRDFGQCFYTTYNEEMAKDWAKKMDGCTVVNKYIFDWTLLETNCDVLKVKRFKADAEWAKFVYNNRYVRRFKRPKYDILVGPLADKSLTEQFAKIRTEGLTFEEVAPLIEYTKFKALQVCFCSDKAIKLLRRIE